MRAIISRRVITAAARLAAFYIGLVILEIVVIELSLSARAPTLHDLGGMAVFLSIPFAFAFLLLAIARRWGFVALWAILGSLWIWMGIESHAWILPRIYPPAFLAWSIFALPLWLIGQAGIPRTSSRRISGSMMLLVCWAILLVGIRFYANYPITQFGPPHRSTIADLLAWIWAPMPLILSAFAIRHVWRGTAKPIAA